LEGGERSLSLRTVDSRALTSGEVELARSVFGQAIDYSKVQIVRRKWWPLQPRNYVMAPSGRLHFHPAGNLWSEDFSKVRIELQALFIHEMTHVWQTQQRGPLYLLLMRHPFCRYDYAVRPGWRLDRYGLEQQAEIAAQVFLLRNDYPLPGAPPLAQLESILPFR
jgi:hypothetical protein